MLPIGNIPTECEECRGAIRSDDTTVSDQQTLTLAPVSPSRNSEYRKQKHENGNWRDGVSTSQRRTKRLAKG